MYTNLERKTEGLLSGSLRWLNGIDGLEQSLASDGSLLDGPSLVPGHVSASLNHVVTFPTRDGDDGNVIGVITDLLDVATHFTLDFIETGLVVFDVIHLVDTNDELLHTKCVGEKSMLTGLAILGDTSFEFTSARGNDEDGTIGLASTSDHVLDEITMARSINDGDAVLRSLELPEGDINGNTTLTLGLQLVQHPGVFEGAFASLETKIKSQKHRIPPWPPSRIFR